MSPAVRESLASALAPLAVLAVVVSGVSAAVAYAGDDGSADPGPSPSTDASGGSLGPTGRPEPPPAPDGTVRIEGDAEENATFLIPDDPAWVAKESGEFRGFQTAPEGSEEVETVGVNGPGIFKEEWCDAETGSLRGFVGFALPVPAEDTTVQQSAEDTLTEWTDVVTAEAPRSTLTDPVTTPVRLDDGSAAWTSAAVVSGALPGSACAAPGLELRVVAADAGAYVTNLIVVRDVTADGEDLDGGLSSDEADDVLRSLAPY